MTQNFSVMEHDYCKKFPIPKAKTPPPEDKADSDVDVDGVEEEPGYCICRTTDIGRFMIGCDSCNEWYHGDCISITEEYAKNIEQYFCLKCRENDPSLEIMCKDIKEKSDSKKKMMDIGDLAMKTMLPRKDIKSRKTSRRCAQCVNCYREDNCGRCDFCKDMRQFGGPYTLRQKCRQRQCMNFGKSLGRKDVFAPVHASVTPKKRKDTFTPARTSLPPNKEKDMFAPARTFVTAMKEDNFVPAHTFIAPKQNKDMISPACTSISPNEKDIFVPVSTFILPKDYKQSAMINNTLEPELQLSDDEEDNDDFHIDYRPHTNKKLLKSSKYKSLRGKQTDKHRKKNNEKDDVKKQEEPRQCLGPGCVYAARYNSKYCCDECGVRLATDRIFEILPNRIEQWQRIPCVADENNQRFLEEIRCEQQEAKDRLNELNEKKERLEIFIMNVKKTPILIDHSIQDGYAEEDDTLMSIYCVTCGHEISAKNALKHMENCFNKYESQASFVSFYQANTECNDIFCNFFNPQQKTYCKRLKVLCPEHLIESKVSDDEVCGCPLVMNLFVPIGDFCRLPKKTCLKHYKWEKFYRAEIDLEMMKILFKLDDLLEQEKNIRQQMANRGGVMGLLLHQTICHDQGG